MPITCPKGTEEAYRYKTIKTGKKSG